MDIDEKTSIIIGVIISVLLLGFIGYKFFKRN